MNNNKAIALVGLVSTILLGVSSLDPSPALAHHPSGGNIPSTFSAGFLSGLGHPVIGIDHLVFVIAIGLLAALKNKLGLIIPACFILATAIGTGIHLQGINLPLPELIISASVLIMGVFLAKENFADLAWVTSIAAIAGVFHGYAYGESIVGAEIATLQAYLLGFCAIQLGISVIAFGLGRLILNRSVKSPGLMLRFAGFTLCGIGFAFVSSTILG